MISNSEKKEFKTLSKELEEMKKNVSQLKITRGVALNPASKESVRELVRIVEKICKRSGQCFNVLVVDGSPNKIIINDLLRGEYYAKRTLVINGLLHTFKEFLMLVCTLIKDFDVGLLDSMGFVDENAQQRIADAKDMHKSFDVCKVLEKCLRSVLIQEAMKTKKISIEEITDEIFSSFVFEDRKKAGFIFYLYRKLRALVALKDAVRSGDFKAIDAAQRCLDELIFRSPREGYSKIRVWEVLRKKIYELHYLKESGEEILKLLNEFSIRPNNDGISFEGLDAKLEELNKILKRLVNSPTTEQWLLKSSLFEEFRKLRKVAMEFFGLDEDLRGEREASHVIDEMKLTSYLSGNFYGIDKQIFSFKKGKRKVENDVCVDFENELRNRMKKFGMSFREGLMFALDSSQILEKNEKVMVISKNTIPPIIFKKGILENADEDEDESEYEQDDDEEIKESPNRVQGGDVCSEELSKEHEEERFEIDNHDEDTKEGEVYISERHVNDIVEKKLELFCCGKDSICGKKLNGFHEIGRCCVCRCFFVEGICGTVLNQIEAGKVTVSYQYCKGCLVNSHLLTCSWCNTNFSGDDIVENEIDICDICFNSLFHLDCSRKNIKFTKIIKKNKKEISEEWTSEGCCSTCYSKLNKTK